MKKVNLKKAVEVLGGVTLLLAIGILSIATAEEPVQKPVLPEQARGKGPKLIWEKGFEEEIEKVAVERGRSSAVIAKKIIEDEKKSVSRKIVLLDGKGNVSREQILSKGQRAYTSENGQFIAVLTYGSYGNETPARSLVLMDRSGKTLWEATNVLPGGVIISNDGRSTVALGYWAPQIAFYDSTGKLVGGYEGIGWQDARFSSAGDLFVITAVSGKPARGYTILFNEKGKVLWKRLLDGEGAGRISISQDGGYIVVSGEAEDRDTENIYCFNRKGKLLWKYDDKKEYKRNIRYSGFALTRDGSHLVAVGGQKIQFFNTISGKRLWVYEIEERDILHGGFSEADISADGEYIVVRKSRGQGRPTEIYLFDKSGKKIWTEDYDTKCRGVRISEDGKRVLLWQPKKISLLETIPIP